MPGVCKTVKPKTQLFYGICQTGLVRKTSDARLKDRASLIFYLNTFFDIVNLAAVPGEESMSNILSSGNENNADKTFSFSADLSWSSYPYKIWTKNGEDQTVYYGDWIDWKKLQ